MATPSHRPAGLLNPASPGAPPPPPYSCSDITERHRRLGEITEMIHTASLVHDDVLDDCDIRRGAWHSMPAAPSPHPSPRGGAPLAAALCQRAVLPTQLAGHAPTCYLPAPPPAPCAGKQTVNSLFGTRVAVLAGDFLFAQSSWFLANLDNLEVRSCWSPSLPPAWGLA